MDSLRLSTRAVRADIAVLGGGTAGAVVAGLLAERLDGSVLLVEAGPDYGHYDRGRWPAELLSRLTLPETHDWGYESGAMFGARTLAFERAKVIGGCSAHNGCSQTVGHSDDYDDWGVRECDAAALVPHLASAARRLRVRMQSDDELTPFQQGAMEAMIAAEIPRTDDLLDLHGGAGCGPSPVNVVDGVRFNTAFAYLDPVRHDGRLRVADRALVDRLELAGSRVIGARVVRDGTLVAIEADRFVLCGGTYGSPAVLLRSGIGSADELRALGIASTIALPGVGRNLHDHAAIELSFAGSDRLAHQLEAFAAAGRPVPDEQVIGKALSPGGNAPFDVHLFPWVAREAGGWVCRLPAAVMTPRSRGVLRLSSADPDAPPQLDHRYLTDADGADLAVLRHGVELCRELAASGALAPLLGPSLDSLGTGAATDDALTAAVCHYWHPVGTCAMGADPETGAVVDGGGRVHGAENLWVIDGSVIPAVPRATTNLPIVALAEHLTERVANA